MTHSVTGGQYYLNMRFFVLAAVVFQVAFAEPAWWERQGERYAHVEGWSVEPPPGWKAAVRGDSLELNGANGNLTMIMLVLDSQTEVELGLGPVYADLRAHNGGQIPRARRFTGRTGLQFVSRMVALKDRQAAVVHVYRPGSPTAHLVVFYQVKFGSLPDAIENVLRGLEYRVSPPVGPGHALSQGFTKEIEHA